MSGWATAEEVSPGTPRSVELVRGGRQEARYVQQRRAPHRPSIPSRGGPCTASCPAQRLPTTTTPDSTHACGDARFARASCRCTRTSSTEGRPGPSRQLPHVRWEAPAGDEDGATRRGLVVTVGQHDCRGQGRQRSGTWHYTTFSHHFPRQRTEVRGLPRTAEEKREKKGGRNLQHPHTCNTFQRELEPGATDKLQGIHTCGEALGRCGHCASALAANCFCLPSPGSGPRIGNCQFQAERWMIQPMDPECEPPAWKKPRSSNRTRRARHREAPTPSSVQIRRRCQRGAPVLRLHGSCSRSSRQCPGHTREMCRTPPNTYPALQHLVGVNEGSFQRCVVFLHFSSSETTLLDQAKLCVRPQQRGHGHSAVLPARSSGPWASPCLWVNNLLNLVLCHREGLPSARMVAVFTCISSVSVSLRTPFMASSSFVSASTNSLHW